MQSARPGFKLAEAKYRYLTGENTELALNEPEKLKAQTAQLENRVKRIMDEYERQKEQDMIAAAQQQKERGEIEGQHFWQPDSKLNRLRNFRHCRCNYRCSKISATRADEAELKNQGLMR